MRITIKIAILFAAVMLVSTVMAVTVFAQPLDRGFGKERGQVRSVIEPILMGHGFALNETEHHILDVTAIKMRNPSFIRSLHWQNKNTREIANEIQNNAQASTTTRAHLRFAGQAYALNVTCYDNQSLTGDVLTLPPGGTTQTGFTPATVGQVGHISLLMSKYEGVLLITGNLTMNNTNYNVLLTSPTRLGEW